MRDVSDKMCREYRKSHLICNNFSFFGNRAVCEIMRNNIIEPDRPQVAIWRMRVACWIPKARKTHTEYVILTVFPLLQWLHERCTHIAYLVVCEVALVSVNRRAVDAKCLTTILSFATFEVLTAVPITFQVCREVRQF